MNEQRYAALYYAIFSIVGVFGVGALVVTLNV